MQTASPKTILLQQIRDQLTVELSNLEQAARAAAEAATHEEARPENEYDTRGLEASYLAGAQMERVNQLRDAIQRLNRTILPRFTEGAVISLGALVELGQEEQMLLCFLSAFGAGLPLNLEGRNVQVVTPQSPLGRALVGRTAGESIVVDTAFGPKDYDIVSVS
jgi:transcription elongation GreA/GreB family factor